MRILLHLVPLAEVCVVLGLLFGIVGSDTCVVLLCDIMLRGVRPAVSLDRIIHQEWPEDRAHCDFDEPLIVADEHAEGRMTPEFLREHRQRSKDRADESSSPEQIVVAAPGGSGSIERRVTPGREEPVTELKELNQVPVGVSDEQRTDAEVHRIVGGDELAFVPVKIRLEGTETMIQEKPQDIPQRANLQGYVTVAVVRRIDRGGVR